MCYNDLSRALQSVELLVVQSSFLLLLHLPVGNVVPVALKLERTVVVVICVT